MHCEIHCNRSVATFPLLITCDFRVGKQDSCLLSLTSDASPEYTRQRYLIYNDTVPQLTCTLAGRISP